MTMVMSFAFGKACSRNKPIPRVRRIPCSNKLRSAVSASNSTAPIKGAPGRAVRARSLLTGKRKKMLRLELQKRFERIDEMQDPDPDNITELEIPMSLVRR